MGRTSQRKGGRVEREIVALHKDMGVYAERVPLSGASRYRGNGADVDIYPRGKDEAPFVCEVKSRKNGGGFVQLETWLADFDCLFLKRNNADPLVLLPWRVWRSLLQRP
jgi:Holliday junction resolvase